MWQNSSIRGFFNGIDVRNITENGNTDFTANRGGNYTTECNFLNEAFNIDREPIIEYTIPDSEEMIPNDSFNGCISLKKLTIHSGIKNIGKRAFEGLNFKYIYIDKSKNVIFSDELSQNKDDFNQMIEFDTLKKVLDKFDYNIFARSDDISVLIKFAHKLEKNKIDIPYTYILILASKHADKDFFEKSEFKYFRSELPHICELLKEFPDVERCSFWKFAHNLGCFSKEKFKDKLGKDTEVMFAPKACSILANLLKIDRMKLGNYSELFLKMNIGVKPNQDFLNFLCVHSDNKVFSNVEMLLDLENRYPGIFSGVMENFDKVKSYKETLDDHGKPITISWEKAFIKYYLSSRYIGVNEISEDIAIEFSSRGIKQESFNKAKELREKFIEENVSEHILSYNLKEESILESIDRIKKQIDLELMTGKQLIEELYDKQFTYEWLNKNDPKNYILGLYCSCCATITGDLYGKKVAVASVISNDVQNIVVRDSKGEIISKGAMYVDRKNGYAVINDFELNKKYRNSEIRLGEYLVPEDSEEEKERELIFKAFQRGIYAFVEQYNKENPNNPIKQVNVGWGYNRLKKQVVRLKKSPLILDVPEEYSFKDAQARQFIIYPPEDEKKKKDIEDELINDEI